MHKRISWLVIVSVFGVVFPAGRTWAQVGNPEPLYGVTEPDPLAEGLVRGQMGDVPPPSPTVPWPFGRPRLDQGGFYLAGEFMYWHQTNPLKSQPIAFRGVQDLDGTIHAAIGLAPTPDGWIGSKVDALDANYVSGPNNYTPGFNFTIGYRFESGIALEMRWIHLFDARYSATAGLLPNSSVGNFFEETFLTSPVFNFPPSYAGPGNTTGQGSALALLGIWNCSSLQTIDFVQRFDQWELTFRIPMQESECWRTYGIVGPRLTSMWERFKWRTVNSEANGNVPPFDTASYTNVVSNRLYGVHAGIGNEWMLGDTPAGAFSLSLDVQGAMFLDFAKGRPKYELGDRSTAAQHGRNFLNLVPEGDAALNFWWYPYEGVIVRVGYEAMAFFNTISSPRPVDFDFGRITPGYESTFRLYNGLNLGIGFIF